MIKRIFLSIILLAVLVYLVAAVTVFNRKPAGQTCVGIELAISDSASAGFITPEEVRGILARSGLNPAGKPLDEIDLAAIEKALSGHVLIDRAECYKTPSGNIRVEVSQRIPILHVMSNNGDDYYVDDKGTTLPANGKCVACVPIATGSIEKSFATRNLYKFAVFLQHNPFWSAQVEQLNVLANRNVEIVPRVGNYIIFLGKLENYESKLERVNEFCRKALNQVGWNKYKRISVEMDNQIVCTKW